MEHRRRWGGRAVGPLLVGAVAAAVLSACGDEGTVTGPADTARTVTVTRTVTTPPTAAETETSTPEGDGETTPGLDELDPGTHQGLVVGVSEGVVAGEPRDLLAFDKVDFLTGQEAIDAAREAGVIGPDEEGVPNDYFVRNDNPLVRTLPVQPDAEVLVLVGGSPELQPGTLQEVAEAGTLFEVEVQEVDGVSTVTRVQGLYTP